MRHALAESDHEAIAQVAFDAFADVALDEDTLAWVAGVVYEEGAVEACQVVPEFVARFPDSLHIIRVYLADGWARQGNFDACTNEARIYLRQAKDAGVLGSPQVHAAIKEGLSRAFLLATAAYTEIGARSYSRRVLAMARRMPIEESWFSAYGDELSRLGGEMVGEDVRELNRLWEQFFQQGANLDELFESCADAGMPILAKRVELLAGTLEQDDEFAVDENEFFALIYQGEAGEFQLG